MTTLTLIARISADGLVEGHEYQLHNHAGHYYWLVCGGRWVGKDLFKHKSE